MHSAVCVHACVHVRYIVYMYAACLCTCTLHVCVHVCMLYASCNVYMYMLTLCSELPGQVPT